MRIGIGLSIGRFRPSVLTAALIFRAPLQTNILMTRGAGTPTFTRASTATVIDFEGVVRLCKSGEARMQGWRRVENLLAASEDFSNAAWSKGFLAATTIINGLTPLVALATGSSTRTLSQSITAASGSTFIGYLDLKPGSCGWASVSLFDVNSSGVRVAVNLNTGALGSRSDFNSPTNPQVWSSVQPDGTVRVSLKCTANAAGALSLRVYPLDSDQTSGFTSTATDTTTALIRVARGQIQDVTGQSIQTPAEYVPTGTGGPNFGQPLTLDPWTPSTGWSGAGNSISYVGAANANMTAGSTVVIGKTYLVSFTVTGNVRVYVGSGTTQHCVPGSYALTLTAAGSPTLYFVSQGGNTTVTNLTVTECLFSGANVDGVKCFDTRLDGSSIPKIATSGDLNEPQRTNSVTNNSMVGVVAGTPGTLPSNWTLSVSSTGLSRSVVGSGVLNGVPYVDIRVFGTSAGGNVLVYPVSNVAAANGQQWQLSPYIAIVGGSFSNISLFGNGANVFNSVPTYLGEIGFGSIALGSITSALTRFAPTSGTIAQATTAFISPYMYLVTAAGAVDVTLRIGAPQLEQGGSPSSLILTTTAAAVRAADSLAMPVAANASQGTMVVTLSASGADAAGRYPSVGIDDGSTANRILIAAAPGLSSGILAISSNNSTTLNNASGPAITPGVSQKHAVSWSGGRVAWAVNGTIVATVTGVTMPLALSRWSCKGDYEWLGTINTPAVYSQALSDATLRAITA